jgi:hypothetical protein
MLFLEEIKTFIIKYISVFEPCSVIGMNGMAKSTAFEYLEKNSDQFASKAEFTVIDNSNYSSILDNISLDKSIHVFNIITDIDITDFINKLGNLREKHDKKFVYVLFSTLKSVESAYTNNLKALVRNMYIIKPLDKQTAYELVSQQEQNFQVKLDDKTKKEIYNLSGGHVGLIKDLCSLYQSSTKFKIENLLENRKILSRIELIINDIPKDILENFVNNILSTNTLRYLKEIGFITDDNKIFSPIVADYIQSNMSKDPSLLTETENSVLKVLLAKQDVIVSRDEIAKIMWGNSWNYSYSDWAINQIIKRIRQKLAKDQSTIQIFSKKGKGYYTKIA